MKKQHLDSYEKKIADAIERDEFLPVTGPELRRVMDAVAARKKDASLTIRVNRKDINRIKKIAQKRKIPYQTFLSEVIHRIALTA